MVKRILGKVSVDPARLMLRL